MAKDTLWFPHDFEPTSDPKITALIGEHGGLGYGIYWRIVEMLHSTEGNKLPKKKYIYASLAKQLLTDVQRVQAVVEHALNTCELFSEDENFIWSERVFRNIDRMKNTSIQNSIAGKKSAEARALKMATDVERALNERQHAFNGIQQIREDKIREDKITLQKGGVGVENSIGIMMKNIWMEKRDDYPFDENVDLPSLVRISKFIKDQLAKDKRKIEPHFGGSVNDSEIIEKWKLLCAVINEHIFYCDKSLNTISNKIADIWMSKYKNGKAVEPKKTFKPKQANDD